MTPRQIEHDQSTGEAGRGAGLPRWVWLGGALIAVAALGGVLALARAPGGDEPAAPQPTPTPSPEPVVLSPAFRLAKAGVIHNSDWEPHVEEFDGVPMALVPAGCFMMGSESGDSDERPARRVCFEQPFWIDVHEVTNRQFAALGGRAAQGSRWPDTVRPRQNITWQEADAFCERRGARLPTEAEWEYAARGPSGLVYPWGNRFAGAFVAYGANSFSRPAPVGSRPSGASWVGALDMSGNIAEWVNDWYDAGYYGTLAEGTVNPQGPDISWLRVLRGGSWDRGDEFLRSSYRNYTLPASSSVSVGFRCARSWQP